MEQLISGALRYLENWPCDREDVTYLPVSYFRQTREQTLEGLLIFAPSVCGSFEYSDCLAPSVADGSPLHSVMMSSKSVTSGYSRNFFPMPDMNA